MIFFYSVTEVDFEMNFCATAYVLVNHSPIDEFKLERGLRQSDLLSPFLFLLVTEGLHVLMNALVKNACIHVMEWEHKTLFLFLIYNLPKILY